MILRSYLVEETGCVSYLFGCTSKGKLGVVDPHADLVDEYLKSAAGVDAAITQVFDTHVHADHPSGAAELAERAGAALRLPAGAPVEFEFEPLRDGEIIELGNTRAEAMSTPGHAWAHSSLLVTDTIRGERAGISSNPSSTIGFERRNNPLATGEPPDFVDRVLAELSPPPTQFEEIYRRNRLGGSRAGVAESA